MNFRELGIKTCLNGYEVIGIEGSKVYQGNSNDNFNKDHIIEMLYDIIEYLGESGSKHDIRRIVIGYLKGDDYNIKEAKKGAEGRFLEDVQE